MYRALSQLAMVETPDTIILPVTWPTHAVTAPASPALPAPLKPKRNRSSEPQPCAGCTESPAVPCVSERPCLPKRRLRCHLLPCPRPTGAPVRSTPLCTSVRTAVVTMVVGWGWGIVGSTAIPVVALGVSSTISLGKGKACDVLWRQQNQGRAGRVSLLQYAVSPCTAHGTMPLNAGPCAGTCLMMSLHRAAPQSATPCVRWSTGRG